MGIGTSVFLVVVGAILAFAVHFPVDGINVNTLGVILMVVGVLGGGLSLLFWNSWGGWAEPRGRVYRRERVIDARLASVVVPAAPVAPVVPVPPVVAGVPAAPVVPVQPVVAGAPGVDGAGVPVVGEAVPVVSVVGQGVPLGVVSRRRSLGARCGCAARPSTTTAFDRNGFLALSEGFEFVVDHAFQSWACRDHALAAPSRVVDERVAGAG